MTNGEKSEPVLHSDPRFEDKIKTVLHAHPHFYDPGIERERHWDENFFRFFRPVPSLKTIVEHCFKRKIGIATISACHAATNENGFDPRFHEYLEQQNSLKNKFEVSYNEREGLLTVSREIKKNSRQLPHIHILYSQEVRTEEKRHLADINIIGTGTDISYSLTPAETLKRAKELEAISIAAHPNSEVTSLGLEKTLELLKSGELDSYEIWNASESRAKNLELRAKVFETKKRKTIERKREDNEIKKRKAIEEKRKNGKDSKMESKKIVPETMIRGIAVSDSHYYKQMDASYILVEKKLYENFSIKGLRECLREGSFDNIPGQIKGFDLFLTYQLPLVMTFPGQIWRNPDKIKKYLIAAAERYKIDKKYIEKTIEYTQKVKKKILEVKRNLNKQ